MVKYLDLAAVNRRYMDAFQQMVREIMERGWFLKGEMTRQFEAEFAHFCNVRHAVAVANGLDALTLALCAYKRMGGWADGDEVIVPAFTFVATAQAVVRARLRPVLVDVGNDALMNINLVSEHITSRTRAIIPVHLYGQIMDLHSLREISLAHNLCILEDAAQAHGAYHPDYDGNEPGVDSSRSAAAFSFYPGKNLGALGDGGAVVTSEVEFAEMVRTMANYGSRQRYHHEEEGFNSRMDEIQAAFLRVKLKDLQKDNMRRSHIAGRYLEDIHNPHLTQPLGMKDDRDACCAYHIYPVLTPHRDRLHAYMEKHGIETLIHYPIPLHRQPALHPFLYESKLCFPMAERWAKEELSLPVSPMLTDEEVQYIIDTLNAFQP